MFSDNPNKIAFAHILRGVAVLMVVLHHLFLGGWSAAIGNHVIREKNPFPLLSPLGGIGVGIFFILSGFVISFSLEKKSKWRFFCNRLVRIFPVIWAALIIDMVLLYTYTTAHLKVDYHFDWWIYLQNAALLRSTLFGEERLDFVLWTLEVEVLFYTMVSFLGRSILRSPFKFCIFSISLMLLKVAAKLTLRTLPKGELPSNLLIFLNLSLPHILMMCVGMVFYVIYTKKWEKKDIALAFGVMTLCFLAWFLTGGWKRGYGSAYILAFLIWSIAYVYQHRFNKHWYPVYLLGTVSFSFYLLHQLPASLIVSVFLHKGLSPQLAQSLAFLLTLSLSITFYFCVEKRFTKLSKMI